MGPGSNVRENGQVSPLRQSTGATTQWQTRLDTYLDTYFIAQTSYSTLSWSAHAPLPANRGSPGRDCPGYARTVVVPNGGRASQTAHPSGSFDLPAANRYRTGAGRPGPQYWQQRADYRIAATLDLLEGVEHARADAGQAEAHRCKARRG